MKRTKKTELPKFDATEMRKDEELRMQCLAFATKDTRKSNEDGREIGVTNEEIIGRASAFYNFVKGQSFLAIGETK